MSPLLKPRSRSAALPTETVGHALVVHASDAMSAEARSLASTLPADPEHDLVVADVPTESAGTFWESFAVSLPRGRRGVRLVLARRSRELGALTGHWLSTRLGRTVLAPDGNQLRDRGGAVFVDGGGWVRFRPGREPEREAKRFPRPPWESTVVTDPFQVGTSTAEPLPSGLWLRPDGERGRLDACRNRLTHTIPCRPDVLTIVLGGRDLPELPLDDVKPLWEALPAADRPKARFVHFGPGTPSGQALADLLDEEVTCYTGMPVGDTDVHLLRPDGSHGWNAFVQQLTFSPGAAPRMRAHRAPIAGLPEPEPGIYQYTPDVVIEVVPAGLWLRPAEAPAHADTVRATPTDPTTNLLLYTDDRMRTVAQEVLDRLDYPTRLVSRLHPVGTPEPADVLLPLLAELLELPKPAVRSKSLPPHRGGTIATLAPTPAQWEFYRQHKILTERAPLPMLTAPCAAQEGEVDLLVWSMTARRTEQPGLVMFPPGTSFKVLDVTAGRILLRELSRSEMNADGTVAENRRSLDQLAKTSLEKFADKLATAEPVAATSAEFRLPGVTDE